jgi:hypothetical protein
MGSGVEGPAFRAELNALAAIDTRTIDTRASLFRPAHLESLVHNFAATTGDP